MKALAAAWLCFWASPLAAQAPPASLRELVASQMRAGGGTSVPPPDAPRYAELAAAVAQVRLLHSDGRKTFLSMGSGFVLDGNYARLQTSRHVIAPLIAYLEASKARGKKLDSRGMKLIVEHPKGWFLLDAEQIDEVTTPEPAQDRAEIHLPSRQAFALRKMIRSLQRASARPRFNESVLLPGYVPAATLADARGYSSTLSLVAGGKNVLIVSEAIVGTCLPLNLLPLIEPDAAQGEQIIAQLTGGYFEGKDAAAEPAPLVRDHRFPAGVKINFAGQQRSFCAYNKNLIYPEMSGAPVVNAQGEASGILSERVVETRTGTVTLVFAAALNP